VQNLNFAQMLKENMVMANYLRQKESAMTIHTKTDDTTVDMETLITVIFVIVDDWYQQRGVKFLQGKRGCKAIFSDSELITLILCMDIIPFPSERQFYQFIRANYLCLFPQLVDRSQFNRRARCLRLLIEQLRRFWLEQLGATLATELLLDTKPIPVLSYKRNKKWSDFRGQAAFGVCASRNLKYFGFKLVALTTLDGIILTNGLPLKKSLISCGVVTYLAIKVFWVTHGNSTRKTGGATAFGQLNGPTRPSRIPLSLTIGSTAFVNELKVFSMKSKM
jgi:hypothetical protein